jgi:formate hydrogenlyase subunit 4
LDGLIIEYSGTNLALFKLTFALRSFAISAFMTSLFFPLSFTDLLGGGISVAILDFVLYWVKVFLAQMVFVTLTRTIFGRLKIGQASKFYVVRAAGLSIAGMLLLSIDVLVR